MTVRCTICGGLIHVIDSTERVGIHAIVGDYDHNAVIAQSTLLER